MFLWVLTRGGARCSLAPGYKHDTPMEFPLGSLRLEEGELEMGVFLTELFAY